MVFTHTHTKATNGTMDQSNSTPAPFLIIKMSPFLLLVFLLHIPATTIAAAAQLQFNFYGKTCPIAEKIVGSVVRRAVARDPSSTASIMRMQFHDCLVNGCDASLLLDDTPTMLGEKLSQSNINSLRSYEVIDEAKEELEKSCPGVVSCADIIIMAAREAVYLSGGPFWAVRLGREDSLKASQEDSNNIMPSPRANASFLIDLFGKFNLSAKDLVAMSGSHSIGHGRCFSIVQRLSGQGDPTIEPNFRKKLNRLCPIGGDMNVKGDLDATPNVFDNQYFKDLVSGKGFLNSDQTLYSSDARTRNFVIEFSGNEVAFLLAFVQGMVKMGELQSTGVGEIRRNGRVVNTKSVVHIAE